MIEVGHLTHVTHEKERKDEERGTVFFSVDHACTGRVEEGAVPSPCVVSGGLGSA